MSRLKIFCLNVISNAASNFYFGKDRVLLSGKAAGMVYLNGEGISAALDSGCRAGKGVALDE